MALPFHQSLRQPVQIWASPLRARSPAPHSHMARQSRSGDRQPVDQESPHGPGVQPSAKQPMATAPAEFPAITRPRANIAFRSLSTSVPRYVFSKYPRPASRNLYTPRRADLSKSSRGHGSRVRLDVPTLQDHRAGLIVLMFTSRGSACNARHFSGQTPIPIPRGYNLRILMFLNHASVS